MGDGGGDALQKRRIRVENAKRVNETCLSSVHPAIRLFAWDASLALWRVPPRARKNCVTGVVSPPRSWLRGRGGAIGKAGMRVGYGSGRADCGRKRCMGLGLGARAGKKGGDEFVAKLPVWRVKVGKETETWRGRLGELFDATLALTWCHRGAQRRIRESARSTELGRGNALPEGRSRL